MTEHVLSLATINVDRTPENVVVLVSGELDASNIHDAREMLYAELGLEPVDVVLDLRQVSYVDSTGLSLLLGIHRLIVGHGKTLEMVLSPEHYLHRVLEITALDRIFDITDKASS